LLFRWVANCFRINARWWNVSSRRAGPPTDRAWSSTGTMSIGSVPISATGAAVDAFNSDNRLPAGSSQRPDTKLRTTVPEWNEVGRHAAQQAGFKSVSTAVWNHQQYEIFEQTP